VKKKVVSQTRHLLEGEKRQQNKRPQEARHERRLRNNLRYNMENVVGVIDTTADGVSSLAKGKR